MGGDSAASDAPSTTPVRAVERIVGALLQVSSSDLLVGGDEGTVLALLTPKTALICHVVLDSSSPFHVPTLVATLHNLKGAPVVGRQMFLYIRKIHLLATAIFPIGAIDSKISDAPMSISIFKHFEWTL